MLAPTWTGDRRGQRRHHHGLAAANVLDGRAGDDTIDGRAGDDQLIGGDNTPGTTA